MGTSLSRVVNTADWVFPAIPPTYDASHRLLIQIPCEAVGTCIPAVLLAPLTPPVDDAAKKTLHSLVTMCAIYFHPNAVDIGDCVEDMEAICDGAYGGDAMVIAPEYPGYGLLNEFEPSVEGLDLVALSTWRYCAETLGFGSARVTMWGRSIGCGPAAYLAHTVASGRVELESTKPQVSLKKQLPPSVAPRLAQVKPWDVESTTIRVGAAATPSPSLAPPPPVLPPPPPTPKGLGSPPKPRTDSAAVQESWPRAHEKTAVGALVLIAPYISISAVVEHHTASSFLASVVGPMWEVLELIKDPVMEEVPLCILHPKEDEIIPSHHGLKIYQESVSRKKYGVWLSNASHNFQPEEDHFTLVNAFLKSVSTSRGIHGPLPGHNHTSANGRVDGVAAAAKTSASEGLGPGRMSPSGPFAPVSEILPSKPQAMGVGGFPRKDAVVAATAEERMDLELQALASRVMKWGDLEHWSPMVTSNKEAGESGEPDKKQADSPVPAEAEEEHVASGGEAARAAASARLALSNTRAVTKEEDLLAAAAAGLREDLSLKVEDVTTGRSSTSAAL